MNAVSEATEELQGEFDAPWETWEGHTCEVGGPVTLKEWALHYARIILSKYPVSMAENIIYQGQSSACEPGYEISYGVLFIGGAFGVDRKGTSPRRFSIAALAKEIFDGAPVPDQTNLFEAT